MIDRGLISVYGDSAGWYAEYFDGGRLYLVDSETEFLTIYRAAARHTEYGAGDMIADYAPDEIPDELEDIYRTLWAGIAPYLTREIWTTAADMLNRLNAVLGADVVTLDGNDIRVRSGKNDGYTIPCGSEEATLDMLTAMIEGARIARRI